MLDIKKFSLSKPTLNSKFRIDFDWWQENDRDWHVYLAGFLCDEHRDAFKDADPEQMVDWIDPQTAEVQRVEGVQHMLISHCAKQIGFITDLTTTVDAVFRLFLSNGNTALSPVELSDHINKPAGTILRTLGGQRVYKGIRPCPD